MDDWRVTLDDDTVGFVIHDHLVDRLQTTGGRPSQRLGGFYQSQADIERNPELAQNLSQHLAVLSRAANDGEISAFRL